MLTAGGGSVDLVAGDCVNLRGGWYAYFLGIVDVDGAFTTASITTHGGGGQFLYTVDDITTSAASAAPEPGNPPATTPSGPQPPLPIHPANPGISTRKAVTPARQPERNGGCPLQTTDNLSKSDLPT